MGLIPGVISRDPSLANEQDENMVFYIKVLLHCLLFIGISRLLSYSIWSTITDLFMCLYGYYAFRPFAEPEALIFVENILCFTVVTCFSAIVSIFADINLAMGKQEWYDKLKPWQIICGLVFGSIEIAVYLLLSLISYLLYKNLKKNRVYIDEETIHFMGNNNATLLTGTYMTNQRGGSGSSYATGSQVGTLYSERQSGSNPTSETNRFPGKGYKLNG